MNFERMFRSQLQRVVRILPQWMKPMYLTGLRLALIPIIAICLILGSYWIATLLFVIAVFADALDGELARTRNQISNLGILLDPVADKALIGIVAIVLIPQFFGWPFIGMLLLLETAIAGAAYVRDRRARKHLGATYVGKLKMVAQSVALILALLAASTDIGILFDLALIALIVSIVLAIATLDSYVRHARS